MSVQGSEQRRGPPRIDFRAPIRVLSEDRSQVCWATSTNLSVSGIRVSSMETFSVGSELGLDIPVPGGEDSLAFRCKVVWVERERRCGMGLEFLDLSEEERGSLRQLVAADHVSSGWSRPVKVWFEGQPMPMNARALPGRDGLVVGIELPHLRRLSQVIYHFDEEDNTEGETAILEGVYLEQGEVPMLMATLRPDDGYHHTITSWPPPSTGAAPAVKPKVEPPPEEEFDQEMKSGEIRARDLPIPPDAAFDEEEVSVEIEPEDDLTLDDAIGLEPASEEQVASLSPDRGAREESFQKMRQLESSGVRSMWLWAAAIALTALALASMAYTGLFSRVQSATDAISGGEEEALVAPKPAPVAPVETVKAPDFKTPKPTQAAAPDFKVKKLAPAPAPALAPDAQIPNPGPTATATHLPTYQDVTGGLEITFPVRGSVEEARHYTVDQPNGVAVNLPRARATDKYGNYIIRDQKLVRLLWVKERKGGLQLRVFFRGDKMRGYSAEFKPGLVKLTVKE